MKRIILFSTILFVFLLLSSSATALFPSSHVLKGTLTQETSVFFIGKTTINGSLSGQPLEHLSDSDFVQQMKVFPILGTSRIFDLDTVIVAEDIDISTATSFEDLFVQYYDHITSYTNVEITTKEGLFLLGMNDGSMNLSAELPYAVTTMVSLEVIPGTETRFYAIATDYPITLQCSTTLAALNMVSETGSITLTNTEGRTLWRGDSPNDYLIIQDTSFSFVKQPSLSLLPLGNSPSETTLSATVTPAASHDIQIQQLLHNVSETLEDFDDEISLEFHERIQSLGDLLVTSGFIANGAMILENTNDTITIDHTQQHFSTAGFVRFNSVSISDFESPTGVTVKGDCTLCYLGSHFYNPSAKRNPNGIIFPFELLFVWALCVGIFLYVWFFLRPLIDVPLDRKIKRYSLIIHLIALASAFLLLDVEVGILFGTSALSSLVTQGFSSGTAALFLLEALIWVIGFCILGIPLQLLSYAILRYLGIGKGGSGVWKAIGDLSIWVFSWFYLLLFMNILLSVIDFNRLFVIG